LTVVTNVIRERPDHPRRGGADAAGVASAGGGGTGLDTVLRDLEHTHPGAEAADPEFEAVLVRRLAHRHRRTVAAAAAGRPVPRVWRLLLDPSPAPAARRALAGVGALLHYDLTLAFAGTCTVLGRDPGSRERAAHARVAASLVACGRELVLRSGGPAEARAAGRLDTPAVRDACCRRAEHLWTLRGRPAEAEQERDALDREVHATALLSLTGVG
jgi:hypothetical protein